MADPSIKALRSSAHVAQSEPKKENPSLSTAMVWLSLRRWPDLVRGFLLLLENKLLAEAMLISRTAAELAINAGWITFGESQRFATPDARAEALEQESRDEQKKWWEAMQRHDPEIQFPKNVVDLWTAFCAKP